MKPTIARLTLVLTVFLLTLLITPLRAQDCPNNPETAALTALYEATDGENWWQQADWNTGCSPCDWFGVGCDGAGRVVSLTLRGNGLSGALPASIGDLPYLRFVQLGYNELSGPLPATLFALDSLRSLYLGGNQLSGPLPATFGQTRHLEWLVLADNQLSGELPSSTGELLGLEVLNVTGNRLTGQLPDGLGDLPRITGIYLSDNQFEGCFPADLAAICPTANVNTSGNAGLAWMGDFDAFCRVGLNVDQQGAPCDDGDAGTVGDVITVDCGCSGSVDPDGIVPNDGLLADDAAEGTVPGKVSGSTGRSGSLTQTGGVRIGGAPRADALRVYPNPLVGQRLTISHGPVGAGGQLRLLSLNGRVLKSWPANSGTSQRTLPALAPGVYLIELSSAGGREVTRLLVP